MIASILNFFGCKGQIGEKIKNLSKKEIQDSLQTFLNKPVYRKLTKEIIDSIPDNDLILTIFDNISINMTDDERSESNIIRSLSKGQQAIYSIWRVESEVLNGGFNQLYFNDGEEMARISETGYVTIGSQVLADLIIKANILYEKIKPELEKYDDGTTESFSKSYENNPLDEIDTEFYKLNEHININDLMIKYIRKNINEFTNK